MPRPAEIDCPDCEGTGDEMFPDGYEDCINCEGMGRIDNPALVKAQGYADVYDTVDNGGSVHAEIADMSFEEMADFFSDADPAAYL